MAGQVIINEYLTFIQNKIDLLDELSIVQICATTFTDTEVETGKSILYQSCGDKVRIVHRKGDEKKKRNIRDTIKLLKEVDPDVQPTFVARDLNRLPPVSYDYVDVTRLLKDMTILKTELSEFQTRMSAELVELRNSFEKQLSKRTEENKHTTLVHPKSLPRVPVPNTNVVCPSPSMPAETRHCTQAGPYTLHTGGMQNTPPGDNGVHVQSVLKVKSSDDDEFTLVRNKKRKHFNNLRGTLETTGKIRVVESQCCIYVSRVMKSVSVADIIDHIRERGEQCSQIEMLKQFKETSFNSFKITIPTSKINTFLDTNFWPTGLVYRRYRQRRNPAIYIQPHNEQS
ncbi:unnamed protein product [Leptidea sinapis]|uniref:Uncharacterized protein n=1 Tax=Leptidea sinapis TaxID=189913 RepID=A0A5E4R7T6_9NEOP|nr:unnamed protein product [Leptidea sinapis]